MQRSSSRILRLSSSSTCRSQCASSSSSPTYNILLWTAAQRRCGSSSAVRRHPFVAPASSVPLLGRSTFLIGSPSKEPLLRLARLCDSPLLCSTTTTHRWYASKKKNKNDDESVVSNDDVNADTKVDRVKLRELQREFKAMLQKTTQAAKIANPTTKQHFPEVLPQSLAAVDRVVENEVRGDKTSSSTVAASSATTPPTDTTPSNAQSSTSRALATIAPSDDPADDDSAQLDQALKAAESGDNDYDDENDKNDFMASLSGMNAETQHHRTTNIGIPGRPEDPVAEDGRTVLVHFCYSKYEIMEGATFDDTVGQFHCPLDYHAIKKEAVEFFQEDENAEYFKLEYYHKKRWHVLDENCHDILKYYHEIQTLHRDDFQTMLFIRLPFMYDTADYPEADTGYDDDDGTSHSNFLKMAELYMGKKGEKPKPPPTLADKIAQYLKELKEEGWERAPTGGHPLDPNADLLQFKLVVPEKILEENEVYHVPEGERMTVATRQYILDRAKSDHDLRDILLMQVGGLEHMVRTTHYDLSWPEEKGGKEESDASDEEDYDDDDEDEDHDEKSHASSHSHAHSHEYSAECKR